MTSRLPQPARRAGVTVRIATVALVAVSLGGCLSRSPADTTGSIGPVGSLGTASPDVQRRAVEQLGQRYEAKPGDPGAAAAYSRALRAIGQNSQAVAVLQQAAIRNPKNQALLGEYGKALADAGRLKESAEVLARAHTPERPDWRILSVQGAVADQMGDHEGAQRYYEAALRIAPGEPSILSNQGLSFALAKRLPEAESVLRQAAASPGADARVRQNLALVVGLQGKLPEAEEVLKRDLAPAEAAAGLASIRGMVSQADSWGAIRRSAAREAPKGASKAAAKTVPSQPAAPAGLRPTSD
jgi:Flp pilus assembly protein TadD